MSALVQICFEHNWDNEALHQVAKAFATEVKPQVSGLIWKIFTKDPGKKQSCGIYLFETLELAQAYVDGERVAMMLDSAELSKVSVRVSEVMEDESVLAGAPL